MMNDALRNLLDTVYELSKQTIAAGDEVQPAILSHQRTGETAIIDVRNFMQSARGKDAVAAMAKQLIALPATDAVLFVSEAWTAVRDTPDLDIPPSEDPNRIECVVMFCYDKHADYLCTAPIQRPENILGPLRMPDYESTSGRFVR